MPSREAEWPAYADLPTAPGGAKSGWFVFGEEDEVGRLNLQTPARVRAARSAIEVGEVFSLNAPITAIDPPMFGRKAVQHTIIDDGTRQDFDDKLDNYYPQASSQWDSLAHVGYRADAFYNGASTSEIAAGRRNTIEHWARRGVAGRAVILDLEQQLLDAKPGFSPGETHRITVDELERARQSAGVSWRAGDVMLLHTGYLEWYLGQSQAERERLAAVNVGTSVGLDRGPEMLAYLWDSGVSVIAADNPGVEAMPFDLSEAAWPYGFLHHCLIGQLGIALGEFWWLADLTRSCRTDGRYEAFFTAAPAHVIGGIGSSANALAIK